MVFRAVLCLFFLVFLAHCSSKKGEQSGEPDYQTRIKIKQYVSAGRQLYGAHCANCHQENGEGFAALYPPLKGVGYFKHNISQAICVMKYGMEGEIEVGGKIYNQQMPANTRLTDLELAEIATYIINEFNDSLALVSPPDVNQWLKECE